MATASCNETNWESNKMKPKNLTILGAFLLILAMIPNAGSAAQPNIVVIMVDDMGYSDLGCYGSEIETPRLDALASQGLRFSQFYKHAQVSFFPSIAVAL